jgi:membrane-associated protease RseP (regulator of RpoE activity)
MFTYRSFLWSVVAVATLALFALINPTVVARGGHGGGGHGGFHGGGFHGGGHHNFHPYRPSQHHTAHHADHHGDHQVAHRHDHFNHHHHSWHHGGWGPGFWGGAALGYGLGGWAYDGGNTYVNNDYANDTDSDDDDASDDDSSDDQTSPTSTQATGGFPTDDWPELGINTYAGQYGSTQGLVVVRVVPGSTADKAGIVPGDVILALNGKPTPSADALESILESANLKFTAEVWDARTGRTSTLTGAIEPGTTTSAVPQQL